MYVVRKTKSRFESTILIYVCGGGIELLRCTNKGKYHSVLAVHTFISIKLVVCTYVVCARVLRTCAVCVCADVLCLLCTWVLCGALRFVVLCTWVQPLMSIRTPLPASIAVSSASFVVILHTQY